MKMLVAVLLMIGAQSAFAQTGALLSTYAQVIHSDHPQADFKSGYDHGIAHARDPCNNNANITCHGPAYVWEPGNGFIDQTDDFIDGYIIGFCKIAWDPIPRWMNLKQAFIVAMAQSQQTGTWVRLLTVILHRSFHHVTCLSLRP